jgi:hypothetical protein|tara:strand:+ start:691 stop:870 length:180 start_codon:yes stop_codon:yes gene_type:complete
MDTFNEEVLSHLKSMRTSETKGDYWQGMTELEYHTAKVVDRLLIAVGMGRCEIRIQIKK